MAINKLNIGLISNTASDGNEGVTDQHVLTYVAANNSVEFKELSLTVAGVGTVSANADAVNTQLTANIDTVQDNVTSTISLLSSSNTDIDTVQANLDTFATYANTNYAADAANSFSTITVGDANVVATTATDNVIFATGNGISIAANADAQSLTFSMYAGDIKSDYFTLDGTANTVTLSTDNRPDYTLYVTVGGLIQEPGINYVVSSTTLTLNNTYPILNGTDVEVRYLPYTGEIAASTPSGPSYSFQGSTSGYIFGGNPVPNVGTKMMKFSFLSDTNGSEIGSLSQKREESMTAASSSHAYVAGGRDPGVTPNQVNTIDKVSFTSDGNAVDIANLIENRQGGSAASSGAHGYYVGGYNGTNTSDTMDKISLSSDSDATDVAEAAYPIQTQAGSSSATHGYISAGFNPALNPTPRIDTIHKYPFSSDSTTTDVGEISTSKSTGVRDGHSSTTHGYNVGGNTGTIVDTIEKFPFSSDSPAIDVGELARTLNEGAGQSSTTHGYTAGGSPYPVKNDIMKFPFSSDSPAVSSATFDFNREMASGSQV